MCVGAGFAIHETVLYAYGGFEKRRRLQWRCCVAARSTFAILSRGVDRCSGGVIWAARGEWGGVPEVLCSWKVWAVLGGMMAAHCLWKTAGPMKTDWEYASEDDGEMYSKTLMKSSSHLGEEEKMTVSGEDPVDSSINQKKNQKRPPAKQKEGVVSGLLDELSSEDVKTHE